MGSVVNLLEEMSRRCSVRCSVLLSPISGATPTMDWSRRSNILKFVKRAISLGTDSSPVRAYVREVRWGRVRQMSAKTVSKVLI